MFLLVLITLNCGVTGVYYPAPITDQNPCSETARYTAFYPETNTSAVLTLRTDINGQTSINSITCGSAYAKTFKKENFVSPIARGRALPFVLATQLKLHPLFSLHCLLI